MLEGDEKKEKISNAVEERGQDTTPNSQGNNNNKTYSRQYGALKVHFKHPSLFRIVSTTSMLNLINRVFFK